MPPSPRRVRPHPLFARPRRLRSALPRVVTLRLVVVPLLLLLPLGVLKWRADRRREWIADHPPTSDTERRIQRAIAKASGLRVSGAGKSWQRWTGLKDDQAFVVRDRAALNEIAVMLRCTDERGDLQRSLFGTIDTIINLGTDPEDTNPNALEWKGIVYAKAGRERYISIYDASDSGAMNVRPRFAPRFEALIGRLAARAKAPGSHSGVTLSAERLLRGGT